MAVSELNSCCLQPTETSKEKKARAKAKKKAPARAESSAKIEAATTTTPVNIEDIPPLRQQLRHHRVIPRALNLTAARALTRTQKRASLLRKKRTNPTRRRTRKAKRNGSLSRGQPEAIEAAYWVIYQP